MHLKQKCQWWFTGKLAFGSRSLPLVA